MKLFAQREAHEFVKTGAREFRYNRDIRLTPGAKDVFTEAGVKLVDASIVETVLSRMPDTAIVSVSGLAGYGRSNDIVTRRLNRRHVLVGDGVSGNGPGIPLTASRVGVAAHHQANAILELLLDNEMRSLWARRNNGAGI